MKRRRRNKTSSRSQKSTLETPLLHLHFRLCHVCFNLNESEKAIAHCQKCGRLLSLENISEQEWAAIQANHTEENNDGWDEEVPGVTESPHLLESDDLEEVAEELLGELAEGDLPNLNGLSVRF